jgi:hypothetical protein
MNIIGFLIIIVIIIIISKTSKKEKFETTTTTIEEKPTFVPSYWYDYSKSDIRSKCFSCDHNSKYRHGSECFDCEIKGGHKLDLELNRVLTR